MVKNPGRESPQVAESSVVCIALGMNGGSMLTAMVQPTLSEK
jgi:hypothetical protein